LVHGKRIPKASTWHLCELDKARPAATDAEINRPKVCERRSPKQYSLCDLSTCDPQFTVADNRQLEAIRAARIYTDDKVRPMGKKAHVACCGIQPFQIEHVGRMLATAARHTDHGTHSFNNYRRRT
jgi:hypothetical protein